MMSNTDIRPINVIILRTNLIVHHGITYIFNQATKSINILSAIQEPGDLPPFSKWEEVLENLVQFPNSCTSD